MKKIIIVPVIIVLALVLNTATIAVTDATRVTSQLDFNGTTADCFVIITDSGNHISATASLSHNGTSIGSWSGAADSVLMLSGSCDVVKGETYSLITVYSVNYGPLIIATPLTRTYN